jgi:hypothetical protein
MIEIDIPYPSAFELKESYQKDQQELEKKHKSTEP